MPSATPDCGSLCCGSSRGRYSGHPAYGPTNNAGVDVLGVSQFLVQSGRIVREIRLFDEIALRTQIYSFQNDGGTVTANIY